MFGEGKRIFFSKRREFNLIVFFKLYTNYELFFVTFQHVTLKNITALRLTCFKGKGKPKSTLACEKLLT